MGNVIFKCASRFCFRTAFIQKTYNYDIFFEPPSNIDFAGYVYDKTPFTYFSNIEKVLDNLQGTLGKTFHLFSTNHMVANAWKN